QVPVARAVCASSAAPLLFVPVRVGDRDYVDAGTGPVAHADIALRWGANLVVVIHPAVPVRAGRGVAGIPTGHGPKTRVRDKGLLWVMEQAVRTSAHAQIAQGLRRLRAEVPHATLVTLEPRMDDATMFMHSPMNFSARRTLLRYGYETTLAYVRRDGAALRERLAVTAVPAGP